SAKPPQPSRCPRWYPTCHFWGLSHRLTHGAPGGLLAQRSWQYAKDSCSIPPDRCAPSCSGRAKLRNGSWRRRPWRRPRFPRAQWIPRPLSWSRRHHCGSLVGSVVGLPAVLLPALLLPAAGRGGAGTSHRGGPTAPGILVLLSERQSLLPDRSYVPRGVDQSPVAHTVEPQRLTCYLVSLGRCIESSSLTPIPPTFSLPHYAAGR